MVHLVTGYAGKSHVSAADAGALNAGIIGTGNYRLDTNNQLNIEVTGSNTVRINSGDLVMQGRHVSIPYGSYEDVSVQNGTSGMYRCDIIAAHYMKDSNGIESAELVVLQGTNVSSESAADSAAATIPTTNIFSGSTDAYCEVARVYMSGLAIASAVTTLEMVKKASDVYTDVKTLEDKVSEIGTLTEVIGETQEFSGGTSGTITTCEITLPAGTWLIHGSVYFEGASNGKYRFVTISESPATMSGYGIGSTLVEVTSASYTVVQADRIVKVDEDTVFYLNARHGASGSINAKGRMQAVRIG